ncbi:RDD family protein [Ornithinimicrobium avium]|uniref:RDD family protein n=1 Tax=Ornithinimicrobium avium TaxID=2283195 RepID=A0A345NRW9_9MICO|nr:RDD family protein [Ornithinimicrobium avium]AXH97777.1 RDD family protein [Ornithinimicrobium avium]
MSQQAGWYDDPENADNLRYWDGVQWTDHKSPKRKPGLDQAGKAAQAGWGAAPGQQGQQSQGGHGGVHQGYGQQGHGQQGHGQQGGHDPSNPYAGGTQPPFQGQQWQSMPGGHQLQGLPVPTTPDGQPLAGWWHRVAARIIDGVIILAVGLALLPVLAPGYWSGLMDFAMSQDDPFAPLPADLVALQLRWTLGVGVLGLAYEIIMVTMVGGTLGKLATGLRIRLREEPGKIGWVPSLLRALVYQGVGIVSQLSTVLGFLALFPVLDVLWPLWDSKKQAIHDKAARTNVVRNR